MEKLVLSWQTVLICTAQISNLKVCLYSISNRLYTMYLKPTGQSFGYDLFSDRSWLDAMHAFYCVRIRNNIPIQDFHVANVYVSQGNWTNDFQVIGAQTVRAKHQSLPHSELLCLWLSFSTILFHRQDIIMSGLPTKRHDPKALSLRPTHRQDIIMSGSPTWKTRPKALSLGPAHRQDIIM